MRLASYNTALIVLIGCKLLIHLSAILFEGYGIFRDELYYLSCTDHLAFGYVDHPPLSIWFLKAFTVVFGEDWQVIRLVPMIVGIASLYVLIKTVRLLRGSVLAAWLAGIAFVAAPINMAFSSYYSMNSFETLFWLLAFYQLILTLRTPDQTKLWAILGLIVGFGMMNKISMSWFSIGFVVYLLISSDRRLLVTGNPYLTGVIAFLVFLPFVIWNWMNDWAHIEFAMNASRYKYAGVTRMDFLSGQLLLENPSMLVLFLFSILYLFSSLYEWKEKSLVIIFFVTMAILLLKGHVKSEYMAPSYSAVFITGAIHLSNVLQKTWQNYLVKIHAMLHLASAFVLAPLAVPILPVGQYVPYQQFLGIGAKNTESKEESVLPQFFADMHGWEDFARYVGEACKELTEEERAKAVIVTNNYGEAGAMRYYQEKYNLPLAISRHNSHYLWGLEMVEDNDFSVFVVIGDDPDHLRDLFHSVQEEVVTIDCGLCMPYENGQAGHIVKEVKGDLDIVKAYFDEKNYD